MQTTKSYLGCGLKGWVQYWLKLLGSKGFIQGRDGREHIIVQHAILDKLYCYKEGGVVFLDLQKAFDRVFHAELLFLLDKFQFPAQFCNTARDIYSGSEVVLQVNSRRTDGIEVKSGKKQGCPLSPVICNHGRG